MLAKKFFTLLLVGCFVVSTLFSCSPSLTKANPVIPEPIPMQQAYIRSSGEVDPPTLPIERHSNTYTFTGNLVNCTIEIQKDNIVLDGNGYSLTLVPSTELGYEPLTAPPSIQIQNKSSIVVKNFSLFNNLTYVKYFTGINVEGSSNITVVQNKIISFGTGINMSSCNNSAVIGNELTQNVNAGLCIVNSSAIYSGYNIFVDNAEGIWIRNVNSSTITRNNITANRGILASGYNFENLVFENNFLNLEIGIFIIAGYNQSSAINSTIPRMVFSNYWSQAIRDQIFIEGGGRQLNIKTTDPSPLASPALTAFDPTMFQSLSPSQTQPPIIDTLSMQRAC